jgi:hypothetical protein
MKRNPDLEAAFTDLAFLDEPSPGFVFVSPPSDSRSQTNGGPAMADSQSVGFIRLGDLAAPPETRWVWPGFIPAGAACLLSAAPKCGKSTLLGSLIGGPLICTPNDAPVLILSEEPLAVWHERRRMLGLPDSLLIVDRPTFANTTPPQWFDLIGLMTDKALSEGCGLVIVDTLGGVWPAADENSAGDVLHALAPLRELSETGAALLCVHHTRKSGGRHGLGHRGSSAIAGWFDVLTDMRPYDPEADSDNRRILATRGRFAGLRDETVLEYDGGEYNIVGDRAEAKAEDHSAAIMALLPPGPEGITADELKAVYPHGPAKGKLLGILNHGFLHGRWHRYGGAVKNDPWRFCINKPGGDVHS